MRALPRLSSHVSHLDPDRADGALASGVVAGLTGVGVVVLGSVFLHGAHSVAQARALGGAVAVGVSAALLFLLLPRFTPGFRLLLFGGLSLAALFSHAPARQVPFLFTAGLGALLFLEQETWPRRLVALVGPSLGALWALKVATWLSARHLAALPWLWWAALGFAGLFVAIGATAAGFEWSADGVAPRLRGDPKVRGAFERLSRAIERLPEASVRRQLRELASASAERWIDARTEAAGVSASLDDELEARSKGALLQLETRLETTRDAGVADSLRHLARVHRDTLESFDGLRRRRERLEATAATEAAWLETAAFTVELAPRAEAARQDMAARLEALALARA